MIGGEARVCHKTGREEEAGPGGRAGREKTYFKGEVE